jgi:hypothetical protein
MNAGANGEPEKAVLPETVPPFLASRSEPLDARQVITRFRLDIVLKYLFFRGLDGTADRAHWEFFYRKHILDRTKGVEPQDRFQKKPSTKRSVDDYVNACEELYRSFKSGGFDPTYPIPVSVDKRLLNGAHRTACALATDTRVIVAPAERGVRKSWGFRWFLERGYPRDVLAALLYYYAHLTSRAIGVLILWGPTLQAWREIMEELKNEAGVVGWLDLSFETNPSAFESIVQDIYSLQWSRLEQSHIRRKTIFLNQARRIFRVIVLEDLFEHRLEFLKELRALRARIRTKYNELIPEEAFCTCHASSNEGESSYLIELLLGQGSRKHQLLRPRGQLRPEFGGWLYKLEEELARHGLSRQDVCIVGSSPLEVLGIRNATDIDITIASRFRKRFGAGITHLNEWLDVVRQGYARAADRPRISDDQLIDNPEHHFWFRGYKFADVDIVLRRKALQGRAKDIADVESAKEFFSPEAGKRVQADGANRAGMELISYLVRREKENKGRRL